MAIRRPLVMNSGALSELPSGDSLPYSETEMNQTEITGAHTLVDADIAGDVVRRLNDASAQIVTINTGLSNKQPATFIQTGAGQYTFVAGAGVTLNSADGKVTTRTLFSAVSLIPDEDTAHTYYLVGDTV